MKKFLLLNILSSLGASVFSPLIYSAGQEFANNYVESVNSFINFDKINVNYDLRLLFGDKDHNSEISKDEYKDFDFDSLVKDLDSQVIGFNEYKFKFLTFKPVENDLYVYFIFNRVVKDNDSLNLAYSDSNEINSDLTGYIENNKSKEIDIVNYYLYNDLYFYKGKISNFVENKNEGDNVRIFLKSFTYLDRSSISSLPAIFFDKKETELIYPFGTDWNDGNFYYFQNNTIEYEAHLAMALGVIEAEDYYPVVSLAHIRSNEAKETTVKQARELTYMFVEFDSDLDLSDLISIDVEFNKIKYDYIRWTPYYNWNNNSFFHSSEEYDYAFGDIYGGLYESSEYGTLDKGFSLNGKQTKLIEYEENVLTFNTDGESESLNLNYDEYLVLTDGSGEKVHFSEPPYTGYRYNQDIGNYINGFTNAEVMNDGKPYKKTIDSNYDESDYSYSQIDIGSSYWKHSPYKRDYSFKPIIDLNTYYDDLSEDKYQLSREFIKEAKTNLTNDNPGFSPNFAVLIDGANSDEDCVRSVETIETVTLENGETMPSSGESKDYVYQLKKNVTTGHEIYNAFVVEATLRENNGQSITFNCLGDPAYTSYISFVGHEAPTLSDLIINDINNWVNDLINSISDPIKYLILGIIGIVLILVIIWIVKTFFKVFGKNKNVKVKIQNGSNNKKRK